MKPSLSFNNPHDRWKRYSFSSLFDMLPNNTLSRDKLSREGKIKNIHYGDILIKFGEAIHADTDIVPYIKDATVLPSKGEFLSNGDIIFSDAAEDNTVGKCCELVSSQTDLFVAGLHTIATRPKIQFYPKFLAFYLNSKAFHDQLLPHIQGSKISSITRRALKSTNLVFPPIEDQKKLSHYLCGITDQINNLESEIDRFRQLKAASLQAMFPQEGETSPRLRFKGFEGEWKKIKLGDIGFTYSGLTGKRKDDFGSGQAQFITFLNVLNNPVIDYHEFETVKVESTERQNQVRIGDLFFNTSSETPEEVGMCSVLTQEYDNLYLNSFCFGFRLLVDNYSPLFLTYLMRSESGRNLMKVLAQGATRYNLSKTNFLNSYLLLPSDFEEQTKIADFFLNIDKQINLVEKKLEKLRQIKASCLDLMFV